MSCVGVLLIVSVAIEFFFVANSCVKLKKKKNNEIHNKGLSLEIIEKGHATWAYSSQSKCLWRNRLLIDDLKKSLGPNSSHTPTPLETHTFLDTVNCGIDMNLNVRTCVSYI